MCVCDCGVWLCVWAVCHSLLITMGGHLTCWSTRETHKISKSHLWLPLGDAKLAIYWYEVSATKPQLVANIYPPESKKSNWSSRPSLAGPVLVQKIKNIAFMLARFLLVPGDFLPGSDQGCHNCHRKPMPLTVSVPNSTMGQWVLSAPKPVESRWSVSKPVESRWTWQITRPQSESSYSERAWTCKYKKKAVDGWDKDFKKTTYLGGPSRSRHQHLSKLAWVDMARSALKAPRESSCFMEIHHPDRTVVCHQWYWEWLNASFYNWKEYQCWPCTEFPACCSECSKWNIIRGALFSYQMAFCKSANSLLAKHRNAFNSNQSMRTTFSCHIMITIIIPNERKPVFNLWWIWNKYDIPIILCMNSIMDIPNSNKISGEFGYFRMDAHYFRIFFLIPQPSKPSLWSQPDAWDVTSIHADSLMNLGQSDMVISWSW